MNFLRYLKEEHLSVPVQEKGWKSLFEIFSYNIFLRVISAVINQVLPRYLFYKHVLIRMNRRYWYGMVHMLHSLKGFLGK